MLRRFPFKPHKVEIEEYRKWEGERNRSIIFYTNTTENNDTEVLNLGK